MRHNKIVDKKLRKVYNKVEFCYVISKCFYKNNYLASSKRLFINQIFFKKNFENHFFTRIVNFSNKNFRSKSTLRKFKFSRIDFRELTSFGFFPGIKKSSW